MIDSRVPRFGQALQAVILAIAFLLDARVVVPVLAAVMLVSVAGGPRWSLWAHLFRLARIPPGEPEPAAPPRFAQGLGVAFLGLATAGLFLASVKSTLWWTLGWGPALAVMVLSALAATTSF